jgi:hypothetical protein
VYISRQLGKIFKKFWCLTHINNKNFTKKPLFWQPWQAWFRPSQNSKRLYLACEIRLGTPFYRGIFSESKVRLFVFEKYHLKKNDFPDFRGVLGYACQGFKKVHFWTKFFSFLVQVAEIYTPKESP